MGGNSASTTQGLGQLFGQNTGYQQPNQVAPIAQPQPTNPLLPTPEQAAAATRARMAARMPMAAPAAAPRKQVMRDPNLGGNGGGMRGASSGGNGNGWGGH